MPVPSIFLMCAANGNRHRSLARPAGTGQFTFMSAPILSSAVDMQIACFSADCMTSLQIRNVPDELHRQLKARAAIEGHSLSEYALSELHRAMQRPTRRELIERVAAFERISVRGSAVDAIRAEREARYTHHAGCR